MSLHESGLGDVTRGGQTTLHFFRMFGQVFKKFVGVLLIVYSMLTITLFFQQTDSYERYLGARYISTFLGYRVLDNGDKAVPIMMPDGNFKTATIKALWMWPTIHDNFSKIVRVWVSSMLYSATVIGFLLFLIMAYIRRTGVEHKKEDHLRGGQIVSAKELGDLLKKTKRAGDIRTADIPIIKGSETSHILFTGSPGTGKSTLLRQLMDSIRKRGDRVICYSPSGDFIEWYYRDGVDTVLNPFDDRCPSWNLWEECREDYEYDTWAAAMVPSPSTGDPFWNQAARTLIAALAQKMGGEPNPTIGKMLQRLNGIPLEWLHNYLRSTDAAALVDPASEKMAVSIRATAAQYAKSLTHIPVREENFNIREWVMNDKGDDWVFLNAKPSQIAAARPLISAWVELFTNALMSLPASRTRRVWLIIDELPSLNKLPSLNNFLAQGRKYGGCGTVTFQQISQLREKYGNDGADDIAGLCATWISMRQNDPETAKWSASAFGDSEVLEAQESISYGAHEMRDGISLNKTRKSRSLVLHSEILNLDDLEGFIRLPGDLPVGRYKMKYFPEKVISTAFIPRPAGAYKQPVDTSDHSHLAPENDSSGGGYTSPENVVDAVDEEDIPYPDVDMDVPDDFAGEPEDYEDGEQHQLGLNKDLF